MKKQPLKEIAYDYIKSKIISGDFPFNYKIDEIEISKELNMSRTPVREAINSLAEDEWIEVIPRKGIYVMPFTLKDINDIFQVRNLIEPLIIRLSIGNIQEDKLNTFEDKFKNYLSLESFNKKQLVEIEVLDNNFHRYILSCSKNKYLIKMMENIYDRNHGLKNLSKEDYEKTISSLEEHLKIIKSLREKNMSDLELNIVKHLESSKFNFINSIGNLNL